MSTAAPTRLTSDPSHRDTTVELLPALAQRWSTRVFDRSPVDERALLAALEAARWAPSARNTQPWRFVVARRGTEQFAAITSTLTGFNPQWAPDASALIVTVVETAEPDGSPRHWAAFDLGQAVAHFTIQAQHEGLHTRQMGGFDRAAVAAHFGIAAPFEVVSLIAVGTRAVDTAHVSDEVLDRELVPRERRPLAESLLSV